jgi:polyhydroxyalkanoate synthase subunit PhaC
MPTTRPRRKSKKSAAPHAGVEPINLPEADGFAAPTDGESQPELEHEQAKAASEEILGANPLIGVDRDEILDAAQRTLRLLFSRPQVILEENLALGRELLAVIQGQSQVQPDAKDRRFSHDIWQKSGYFKRLMQTFLAWRGSLERIVDRADASTEDRERAKFILQFFTEAFAPTNFHLGNPGAIQRAQQTQGRSVLYGLQNMVDDFMNNGGMPSMVDERKFQVGKNLAITPGAVVYRSEVIELIQYQPATEKVRAEPLLIVPPQINKFYALDLAPGRSFAEYATQHGVQLFCISWRNPTAAQRDWNMETYLSACREAIAVAKEIAGVEQIHTMAACAGGFTLATLLSHLAAIGDNSVKSATLLVTVLDTEAPTLLGQFASKTGIAAAIQKSRKAGVLEGREMGRVFAWLRPNDLVWLFVANNWVMGNRPPAFDILYWNSDSTRLPAEFHADLLRMFLENPLKHAGRMEVLGHKVDLSRVKTPFYVIAGSTDHITPWQACYESRKLIKGPMTFVLSSSGHIQSIVNPPSNPKSKYYVNDNLKLGADAWRQGATEHAGSWWDHWIHWFGERSGAERKAPTVLGSEQHPPGDAAPGRYVHQR